MQKQRIDIKRDGTTRIIYTRSVLDSVLLWFGTDLLPWELFINETLKVFSIAFYIKVFIFSLIIFRTITLRPELTF